jgi:hypothetical protein
MTEEFNRKRSELARLVERWWHYEDVNLDFQEKLNELKMLAADFPLEKLDQMQLEILEIEISLRDDCLIE